MPFEADNQFGGSKGSGRKPRAWYDAKREILFSKVDDAALADAGEVLVTRMQTGDAAAAAVMLPYILGKPFDVATADLNEARATLLRAQAANAKLEGEKLKLENESLKLEQEKLRVSIAHEHLTMDELRKRIELYFSQFVTPQMFTQFCNSYMQRALTILQNLNPEQWAQLTADPNGLADLKSMLGVQFENAVALTINELPAFGEDNADTAALAEIPS